MMKSPIMTLAFFATFSFFVLSVNNVKVAVAFQPSLHPLAGSRAQKSRSSSSPLLVVSEPSSSSSSSSKENQEEDGGKKISASDSVKSFETILEAVDESEEAASSSETASVGTVNERLLAELEQATAKETSGPRSALGKKYGFEGFQSKKTDEERQAALEQARDLNGVNPVVAILGSFFAFGVAAGLWIATSSLGEWFALHPVQSDVYFIERVTAVFRNVVMGLVSLASGFFGVTGMGIFLLGVQVAIGVSKGELDPTPIQNDNKKGKKDENDLDLGNVMDLMMNKKPGRKR